MQRKTISPKGAGAPTVVSRPGSVSRVGPSGAAPRPQLPKQKNTRDYGKPAAAPDPMSSPNPFGPTAGGSRLGGI